VNTEIREITPGYREVKITLDSTTINLGMLNNKQRDELIEELQTAIDELTEG